MKNSDQPHPFKQHFWLLVLAASVSASIGFYNHLLDVDIQLIQNEFAYRSSAKVDAIHAIFKQHIDASMSISAFLKGEMAQHESLNASEAASFSRAMLDVHPSELVSIVFIPPVGFGASQFVGRDGVGRPDPSLDQQGLGKLLPGAPGIQMLQNQERRWLTRLSLAMDGKHGKGYVVSDWDTAAMLGVAITEMTEAGLDVEVGLVDGGQFSRIYQHHSRLRKAETGEKKMAWRVRLSLNGVELEVRTHASPTVLRQKLSTDPIWALLLGLAFSLILAYLTYNRSRYGERLFRAVERRTQEVEGERLKLASIIDHANEAIMLMDDLGRVLRANPAASNMFGYAAEEWQGLSVHALVPEEIREPHVQWLAEEMAGKRHDMMGKVREVRARRKDGSIFLCEITVNEFATVKGRRLSVILRDLTERKQAEESVRKLSQAIEQAGESILITDRQGIIEYVNPAFTKITGYSTEEAVGQTPRLLKSGQQDAAFYENMWNTITSGKVWNGKIIDRKKDGSFFPAMLTISPIRDESGKSSQYYSHYVGIQSDLTEFENMEKQFHQAQKMEALGTLVGGIAHDFNNILAGITGNLYLAKQRVRETPDVAQKLANVEQLSFRAAEMIQQLLTFSRKGSVDIKPLPLTPFIKQTLKLLRTSVPENVGIRLDICNDALAINGDGTQIHQILMNLITNARDAIEGVDEPRIIVRLEPFQPAEAFLTNHAQFKPGRYAHLSVEDNGCGIPEDQIGHLFEPFFTTKEQGKGTGLGLAMVYGAIRTHHGFIEVKSSAGEGSTFHIYLPLQESKDIAAASPEKEKVVQGRGETILLADDESHVREALAEVLETLGYKVLKAEDGLEALEIFNAHQGEIALAMLDVVMPHCSGTLLAKRIRKINPEVPVIFMTGYDKGHVLGSGEQVQNSDSITKPFKVDVLSRSIRKLLDGLPIAAT